MGKKRTQGSITSFFKKPSSAKASVEDGTPKQPPSKRPRSASSAEKPVSSLKAKTDSLAAKAKNAEGNTVSPAKKTTQLIDDVKSAEESVKKIVITKETDTGKTGGSDDLKSKANNSAQPSVQRRSKKRIVEEDDDDDDDDDEDGVIVESKTHMQNEESAVVESKPTPVKPDECVVLHTTSAPAKDDVVMVLEKPASAKDADKLSDVDEEEEDEDSDADSSQASDIVEEEEKPKAKTAKKAVKNAKAQSLESFKLSSAATWKPGKPVPYLYLAETFAKVEAITGRLAIQAILSDVFRVVIDTTPEDLVPLIYLSINKLAPSHEGVELGVGEGIILKALSQVTGRSAQNLKAAYKEIGDLGDLASSSRATQKTMFPPPPLTVRKVFSEFKAIANMSGKNTQDGKKAKILKMLVAASRVEAKFLTRGLLGKLRIHLADKTVISSLASAMVLREAKLDTGVLLNEDGKKKSKLTGKQEDLEGKIKDASNVLQNVYSQLPVWDKIVPEVLRLQKVDKELSAICKLTPGIPVAPMLAKPTKSISEVLDRFSETKFTCEFKYDGERAQVHRLEDGSVRIYSRNAENLTEKYPDLVNSLPLCLKEGFKGASFIIDGEAVAYDTENHKILPFQVLQGRKRKDVDTASITVKVCVFAFDLLFFNEKSMLQEPLENRRKVMTEQFVEKEGVFMFAKGHDSRDSEEILELLNESIKAGCEGLMVKALMGDNGTYEPANRSQNWLKVKKDYLDGCGDTLDLVPIGGYVGRGKRAGQFGAFLLACYDPDSEEYQSICKIGTGFTEEDLDKMDKFFKDPEENRILDAPKAYYRFPDSKNLQPDKWFEPCQVWEVLCADLSVSPQHTAAIGRVDADKGIALRFPRFLRIRDDKNVEDATSAEQVAELYMQQSAVANKG